MVLSLSFSFSERDQFLRHPFAYALRDSVINTDAAVVPVVAIAFRSTSALIIFRLFQAEQDSVHDFAPVLKLNPAPDDRETSGPIFLRRTRILLGDGQVVQWRK